VDENQDDSYATRRADLDAQFRALPPVGSPDYWQTVEAHDAQQQLPLEVLARSCRECFVAGAIADAQHICELLIRRVEGTVGPWAQRVAAMARSGMREQRRQELAQDCYLKLWEELSGNRRSYLLENFASAFNRLRQHVSHSYMEREGEWKRSDDVHPTRAPRGEMGSLDATPAGSDRLPLSETQADPKAQDAIERAELSDLMDHIMGLPLDDRMILLRSLAGDGQEDIAADLGVTARTIRNRLKRAKDEVIRRYKGGNGGGEEVQHD
jgi:RNA polymerase sigma factor (sigma-70 family)